MAYVINQISDYKSQIDELESQITDLEDKIKQAIKPTNSTACLIRPLLYPARAPINKTTIITASSIFIKPPI